MLLGSFGLVGFGQSLLLWFQRYRCGRLLMLRMLRQRKLFLSLSMMRIGSLLQQLRLEELMRLLRMSVFRLDSLMIRLCLRQNLLDSSCLS
jgi:hypothetical protein